MSKKKKAKQKNIKEAEKPVEKEWSSDWRTITISLALITVVGFLCYSNTFNASFHFDDIPSIKLNSAVKDISKIWETFPSRRFITFLSFAINYHFGKLNVFGYHVVNLTIHILTSFLVLWFMRLIMISPEIKNRNNLIATDQLSYITYCWLIPLFAALLFVAHPIQTQAVTYIAQRAASLATFFYLLSMTLYLKASIKHNEEERPSIFYLTFSLISAGFAMLTKEIAFTLPFAIILIEFYFFSPSWAKFKARVSSLLPLLAAIFIIPLFMIITGRLDLEDVERLTSATKSISRWHYLLTQFNVVRTYIRLILFPVNQNLDYDYPISTTFFEWSTVLSFLLLILLIYTAIRLFKKDRIVSFGIMFFFLALSVESSIIPITDVIFEHRLYLPSIGFVLALSSGLFFLLLLFPRMFLSSENFPIKKKYFNLLFSAFLFLVIAMASIATFYRNMVWKDDFSLWSDVVKKSPGTPRAHQNLGAAYGSMGYYQDEIKEYKIALGIKPTYLKSLKSLAYSYSILGRHQEAIPIYITILRLRPGDPQDHIDLGTTYAGLDRLTDAIKEYQISLSIQPDNFKSHYNLGVLYNRLERYQDAIKEYQKALHLKSDDPEIYNNLGISYSNMGRWQEAIQEYKNALRLKPDYSVAYYNLGFVYQSSKRYQKAIQEYQTSLRFGSENSDAHYNLGVIYRNQNRMNEAIKEWYAALSIDPKHMEAKQSLLDSVMKSIDKLP